MEKNFQSTFFLVPFDFFFLVFLSSFRLFFIFLSSFRISRPSVGYVLFSFAEKNWAMEPVEGPWLETKVSDMQPSTIYYFKVQAKTAVGTGPWSYIKTMKTGGMNTLIH